MMTKPFVVDLPTFFVEALG